MINLVISSTTFCRFSEVRAKNKFQEEEQTFGAILIGLISDRLLRSAPPLPLPLSPLISTRNRSIRSGLLPLRLLHAPSKRRCNREATQSAAQRWCCETSKASRVAPRSGMADRTCGTA
ncbi:hypothetical protein L596_029801 [Steinernema carpocapsae]|uniref:Uncharacterized protein n=1 Tax=Steinernema carpocapsae TaxID=34508 RepID=A0A4U5LQV1_STECR|nr:hypothetical protein L596_029801 [Steinernema carpocapsae]